MGIKTSVSQVALLGGGRNEQPGGILVEEPTSRFARGRSLGHLYVLVDVSGSETERDAVAFQIAQTIRDTYYGRRGSITAGLQQALQEANTLLFEENRNSLPSERRTAGASCVVLRDDDMFVAQAGPAVIYLAQEGQVSRLPEASPWLDGFPAEEMDATSLGERREANTFLFHTPVRGGETILLANCNLAQQIRHTDWPRLLALQPVEAVLEGLLTSVQGHDLSALAVRLGGESPQTAPDAAMRDAAQSVATAQVAEPDAGQATGLRRDEWLRGAGLAVLSFLGRIWLGLSSLLRSMMPDKRSSAPVAAPVETAPAPKKRPVRRRPSRSDPAQKILIGVAFAIPIIVGIIVLVTLLQRGQAQRAELDALWQEANARWNQAEMASEAATVRDHLTAAEQSLEQLLERWPEHAEAQDLRSRVQSRLDVINQVRRVDGLGKLTSYEGDAILSRVVVQGTHIFVLDRGNDRIYHHQLTEQLQSTLKPGTEETVLVSKGSQVAGVLVGDLVDMVWMPLGNGRQKSSLIILESGGALLDYDPTTGELTALEVGATDQWQFPELIGSHSGRFYVLDSTANKIWRYNPTPDGYSGSPDDWLQEEIDLAGVVDMAIGDSIFLLYANGQIRRLTLGEVDSFETSDWDTAPRNPSALFTRPPEETQWLYLGDRGNSRIVQVNKDGGFRQQFRVADSQIDQDGDPLAELSSLFVDEIGGYAFVLGGNGLYALKLPASN